MSRYNDKTDIQREWLIDFSKSLRQVASMLEANAQSMEANEQASVAATHFKTAKDAMEGLVKFCGAISAGIAETSFHALQESEDQPKKTIRKNAKQASDQKKR